MNFCTESLGTRIAVIDRVSEEGYDITNLLKKMSTTVSYFSPNSGNGSNNSGSFMAARFIRPPVTIRLDFPIPIHISHIVIDPKVGQQISTGFKIQVDINSKGRQPEEAASSLHQISREFLQGPQFPETVVFRNPRFILHRKFFGLPLAQFEIHRNHPNSFELRHPTYNSCERVFSLYLTIERAESPSRIPVIGSFQIWGQPSKWVTAFQVRKIMSTWRSEKVGERKDEEGIEPPVKRPRSSSPAGIPSPVEIPEDFLDPITVEIMIQPVRLPCGIAIDSKTLEKYSREEAKWGRLENDPFTGKLFTEDSRPISDFSLKARIDSFLTQNANEIRVPRTLGYGTERQESCPGPQCFHSSRITTSSLVPDPAISTPPDFQPRNECNSTTTTTSIAKAEKRSNEFMDQELARILSSGPSLKPPALLSSSTSDVTKCFKCKSHHLYPHSSKNLTFYKSACNHTIVCRKCLVGMDKREKGTCSTCSANWCPKDLTRIFI